MLVPKLERPCIYAEYISQSGLEVTSFDDLSANVSKTCDLAIVLIRKPALWQLAFMHAKDFIAFVDGFDAMRAGYKSKALVYGALIAQKA